MTCTLNTINGTTLRDCIERVRLKESGKETVVFFIQFKRGVVLSVEDNTEIKCGVVKCSDLATPYLDNIGYEAKVYKAVFKLITANISPHFVEYLTSFESDTMDISNVIGADIGEFLKLNIKPERVNVNSFKKLNVLITRCIPKTNSLQEFLTFYPINRTATKELVFQIYYTIYCMGLNGIMHNDLHSGNILIKESKVDKNYVYESIPDEFGDTLIHMFTLHSRFKAYIFDFDRASAQLLGDNEYIKIRGYGDYSQDNTFYGNRDMIKLCCYIYHATKEQHLDALADEFLSCFTNNIRMLKIIFDSTIKDGNITYNCVLTLNKIPISPRVYNEIVYPADKILTNLAQVYLVLEGFDPALESYCVSPDLFKNGKLKSLDEVRYIQEHMIQSII